MKKYIFAAVAALLLVSCGGKDDPAKKASGITGDWNLVGIEVKSATLGSETVDVYLSFASDNTFTMYQMVGTGRYRLYTGTYSYSGGDLSGKYADGTSWATSYTVEFNDDGSVMYLTGASGQERDTYRKASIPASVTENAI
ncbi:MAG: lipocalin family protein [Bacteroidales bacterium]|nr:lipocalin family protein [Bacteroidales bacterium]